MMRWIGLFRNEWMKLFRKKSTWVMMGILIIGVFAIAAILKWDVSQGETMAWEEVLQARLDSYHQSVDAPEMSEEQRAYLKEQIALAEYRLRNNATPLVEGAFWWYVDNSKNLFSLVLLFTIIAASGIVANEFSSGTIKLLAIRPITRGKLLYSKYVTILIYALFMTVILILTSMVAGVLFFDFENTTSLVYENGEIFERAMLIEIFQWYIYSSADLIMMVTIAFMLATVFRSSALAIGLSIFLLFTGKQVVMLLQSYEWANYILFVHSDLTQYLHPAPMFEGNTVGYSLVVLLIYFAIFHLISYFSFTKRDIAV